MTDLRKNQGPLGNRFNPPAEENLPLVTEIVEKNGVAFSREMMGASQGTGDLVDILHFSDWGDIRIALKALASVLEDEPETSGIIRIMRKTDGEVVHVVHLNVLPFGTPELKALKNLLTYSWRDIGYEYDGLTPQEKRAIGPEEFAVLKKWIGAE